MSLLDDVAVMSGAKAGAWIDRAVSEGRKLAGSLDPAAGDTLRAGMAALVEHREALAGVPQAGFTALASRLALGQESEARLVYLATRATYDERMSALDAAMGAALKRKQTDDEAWAAVKQAALDVLAAAGKAAIPLLLAAV